MELQPLTTQVNNDGVKSLLFVIKFMDVFLPDIVHGVIAFLLSDWSKSR